jgi:hypothetical protein
VHLPGNESVSDIAADTLRSRVLILVRAGASLRVSGLDSNGAITSTPAPYGMVKGSLAVTGAGTIWVAGFAPAGAALVRLDPTTLETLLVSPLVEHLGPGAVLQASGTGSLLVSPGNGATAVWCIDGQDGVPAQRWGLLPDRAASGDGLGYATSRGGLFQLHLAGRCTG